jgi:hypothetical protein
MITLHRGLPCHPRMRVASVAWTRKTFALAIHMTCLGLFGLTVVWPVASPMASGELAREFKPVLEALAALAR